MPDELFEWMLEEVCCSRSVLLREEYSALISVSVEQITRLISPAKLESLFARVGAARRPEGKEFELTAVRLEEDPYHDRSWACVKSLILLLRRISDHMVPAAVTYAAQTLLRMSMDTVLIRQAYLLAEYGVTIKRLLDALTRPSWETLVCRVQP